MGLTLLEPSPLGRCRSDELADRLESDRNRHHATRALVTAPHMMSSISVHIAES